MIAAQTADYLLIPLLDGTSGIGQVIDADATAPGTFCLGLTLKRGAADRHPAPMIPADFLAFANVAQDPVLSEQWPIAGFDQLPALADLFDGQNQIPDHLRNPEDSKDPAIVEAFLSACHGLYPWDGFGTLFETMLRAPELKPAAARP